MVLETDHKKRQIRLSIKAAEDFEEIIEDEEPEEAPPTAMEVALRKAMEDPEDITPTEKSKEKMEDIQSRGEQEDILSRTLKERVKSSTDNS